jgi:thiol-disulfide isomerase/thioredoxin
MIELGRIYQFGFDVPANDAEAARWFQKASDLGNGTATARLIALLEDRSSAVKNPGEAKRLRQRAREQLGTAAEQLILLYGIQLDPLDKQAPNAKGTIDGKSFQLSDHRGKVVVLKFGATWCGPCRDMIPHLKSMVKRLEREPFVLLDVDIDKNKALSKEWEVRTVPAVYVIDAGGVIRDFDRRDQELEQAVQRLLKQMKRGKQK